MKKNKKHRLIEEISKTINGDVTNLIEKIVNISNKNKILYRGIKRGRFLDRIAEEGIKPLTPESGPCSFWSTGLALFHPSYDSPFFHIM